jgi:uncharacterized protein YeaO (DUF488 family)
MEIRTSYYSKASRLPFYHYTFVQISNSRPDWFDTIHDIDTSLKRMLCPPWSAVKKYKEDSDWQTFTETYKREVLDKLDRYTVLSELECIYQQNGCKPLVLLCWETKQCHRFLLSDWLACDVREL